MPPDSENKRRVCKRQGNLKEGGGGSSRKFKRRHYSTVGESDFKCL